MNNSTAFPVVSGFDQDGWSRLAKLLVSQDIVLAPADISLSRELVAHASSDSPSALPQDLPGQQLSGPGQSSVLDRRASALSLVQNWEAMGYVLSKDDVLSLCALSPSAHAWMDAHETQELSSRLGGGRRMRPMYPNFPREVMKMSEMELLYNALVHYYGDWAGVRVLPHTEKERARSSLPAKDVRSRVLRLVDVPGLRNELAALYSMNTVWTPAQAELAVHALPLAQHWSLFGPSVALPQRENQARLTGAWLAQIQRGDLVAPLSWPSSRVSATDILRAAVAYSGGDPSLASSSPKVPFARFSRPMRRVCLSALETALDSTRDPLSELHAHRQSWLRLAERIHPGEWAKKFPWANELLSELRNEPAPVSWSGQLDALLGSAPTASSVGRVLELFSSAPGLGARALTRVLRWTTQAQDKPTAMSFGKKIVKRFATLAPGVDTPLLLSLEASLLADASSSTPRDRVMLPKGQAAWRYRVPASLSRPSIPQALLKQAAQACEDALLARFSALPDLGKVYVEPGLDGILVPKGLRSSSSQVCSVTRGSLVPVAQDAKTIRLFLWWKDTDQGRVDVDLSAVGLDEKFNTSQTCNFHGLKKDGMVHSGDFTSAPNGAAEFIDVYPDKLHPRTRYIILAANVYSGPNFSQVPDCFVGWQERNSASAQRGNVMELGSVVEKFPVTSNSRGFIAAAFDVKQRRLVWLDMPLRTRSSASIYHSHSELGKVMEDFSLYAFSQPTIARLVELHVAARNGNLVDAAHRADTVFCVAPAKARPNQKLICAIQPQSVASELLTSSTSSTLSLEGDEVVNAPSLSAPQPNPLNELVGSKVKKSPVRRKRGGPA